MKLLAAFSLLLVTLGAAHASNWSGFYSSNGQPVFRHSKNSPTPPPINAVGPGACVRAILAAQERHGIPGNLLLGIGLQEAGTTRDGELTIWPWSVNAAGEGRFFDGRSTALEWVRRLLTSGVRSIDVGCMQINLRWHPDAFASLEEGFDPDLNADYAARFLLDLYRRTGDWTTAAGSYHSFTPEKRDRYLRSLRRNVAVANQRIGRFLELALNAPEPRHQLPAASTDSLGNDTGHWSASLSNGTEPGGRSIYGNAQIQPILPAFRVD